MEGYNLSAVSVNKFAVYLRDEERAAATIEKYVRDVKEFICWLNGGSVTKEAVISWRNSLLDRGRAPGTVNAKLSALNSLFRFFGWNECRVKFLKIQRKVFRENDRELTKKEYQQLLKTAYKTGKERLALLMEAICSTGIRVSEVKYITVEAVQRGQAAVNLKGKIRVIILPEKLCSKLQRYAEKQKIALGEIFIAESGKSLSRKQIWREMKTLCQKAGVESTKVFPHNLRHLFATVFYQACRDIVKVADVLGHSSIETTRIYLLTAGEEHARCLERLELIS